MQNKIFILALMVGCITACKKQKPEAVITNPVDTTAPELVIQGKSSDTSLLEQSYFDRGVKAFDKKDGDISAQVKVTNKINEFKTGSYGITYTATDAAGNTASLTRTVTIINSIRFPETVCTVTVNCMKKPYKSGPYYSTLATTYTATIKASETKLGGITVSKVIFQNQAQGPYNFVLSSSMGSSIDGVADIRLSADKKTISIMREGYSAGYYLKDSNVYPMP